MAAIVKRKRRDGSSSWFVKYRDGTGKTRWEQFDKLASAKSRRAKVETLLAESGGTWRAPTKVTFREAADEWWAQREGTLRPQSRRNYRSVLDRWLLPVFGDRLVVAIRPSDVQAFRARMEKEGKAANTIQAAAGVFRQVLARLVADGALRSNPADYRQPGKRPGRAPRRTIVPEPWEVSALIAAARPAARPVLELIAATGLRRAEALHLKWDAVDFEAREIRIVEAKTEAGERVVPMFGSARRVLLEQKARSRFKRPGDYVFLSVVGTAENLNVWHDREYLHARKQAGLRDTMRLHDLRHAAVSHLIAQGANVLLVARVAGHSKPDVTLRVYAHLFDRELAEAATRYDPLRDVAVDRR